MGHRDRPLGLCCGTSYDEGTGSVNPLVPGPLPWAWGSRVLGSSLTPTAPSLSPLPFTSITNLPPYYNINQSLTPPLLCSD